MQKPRLLTYAAAINEAIDQSMDADPAVIVIGEGVPDPKGIFGTTSGLMKKYGPKRVFDMPVSENGMTGVCIGASLRGIRPILVHQRVDFSLLSFDQLINNGAKWYFMFGSQQSVPLLVRVIIGRGWGQGPAHAQSLQALFAHIPGLRVIMPATPRDAKGLTASAIRDNNPVISLEHRWVHQIKGQVPEKLYYEPLGKAKVLQRGTDLTVAATSYEVIEALAVAQALKSKGINIEVIDIRSLKPFDESTILNSVAKTKRLLLVDTGWLSYGITGEIITRIVEKLFKQLKCAPRRIGLPDIPVPSSSALTKDFYPNTRTITRAILEMLGENIAIAAQMFQDLDNEAHDVPHAEFTGPF